MNRLDVSFLGRGSNPIIVRSAREIETNARFGSIRLALKVAGITGIAVITVILLFCITHK